MNNTIQTPTELCPNVYTVGIDAGPPNDGQYLWVGDFRDAAESIGKNKAAGTYPFNMLAYYFASGHGVVRAQMYDDLINPYWEYKRTKIVLLGTQAVFETFIGVRNGEIEVPGLKKESIKVTAAVFDIIDDEAQLVLDDE